MKPIRIEDGTHWRVAGYRCPACEFVILRPKKAGPNWHLKGTAAMREHIRICHGPLPPVDRSNARSHPRTQDRPDRRARP